MDDGACWRRAPTSFVRVLVNRAHVVYNFLQLRHVLQGGLAAFEEPHERVDGHRERGVWLVTATLKRRHSRQSTRRGERPRNVLFVVGECYGDGRI